MDSETAIAVALLISIPMGVVGAVGAYAITAGNGPLAAACAFAVVAVVVFALLLGISPPLGAKRD